METTDRDQIVNELRELCTQYQAEVPSRRRTWPKSIKARVLQLLQSELSCEQVSGLCGISVATVYSWKAAAARAAAPTFLPVQIVEKKAEPVAARPEPRPRVRRRGRARPTPTIIVIAPNGLRFEGLDVSQAIAIATRFGAQS
jgi:transposase-like protein